MPTEPHSPPSRCPVCEARILRRIYGWWCPRCGDYLEEHLIPVYSPNGDRPLMRGWRVRSRVL